MDTQRAELTPADRTAQIVSLPPRPQRARAKPRASDRKGGNAEASGLLYSDAHLTDRFVERHGDQFRYVAAWSKWMQYDGMVWKPEGTHLTRDLVRKLCQEVAGDCPTK